MRFLIMLMLLLPKVLVAQVEFFDGDFEQLQIKSKSEQRVFFIDMYTSWCGYCKKMDATTFQNEQLGEYVGKKFLAYKMNAEHSPGKDLAIKYGVKGYPTVLVFNPKGELIDKIVGYKDAASFKLALEKHEELSKVRNVDISVEERYLEFQREDMAKTEQMILLNPMDEFVGFKKESINFGQDNKRFEFEELQFDIEKKYGEEKAREFELYYQLGKGDDVGIKKELINMKIKGFLSDAILTYFIRYYSIDSKPEIEQLRWVNEVALTDKSIESLELKAFVQYRFGDLKDAKETLKELEKKKKKYESERIDLLKELIGS